MSRKYTQTKRIENSYEAYRKDWHRWRIKGYAMKTKEPMSFTEYKQYYRLAKLSKQDHIASKLAAEGRVVSHEEARMINSMLRKTEDKRFENLSSIKNIKKNIGTFKISISGVDYESRQGLYLAWKLSYGEERADELFGY